MESRSWVSKATSPPNLGHTNGLLPKKGRAAQANRLECVTCLGPIHSPRQQRFHHRVTPYTPGSKGESLPPLEFCKSCLLHSLVFLLESLSPRPLLCAHAPPPPRPFQGILCSECLHSGASFRVLSPLEEPWGAHGLCLVLEDAENLSAAGLPARRTDSRPESRCSGFLAALSTLRTQIHLFMFF